MPVTKNYKKWTIMRTYTPRSTSDYIAPFIFKSTDGSNAYVRPPQSLGYNSGFYTYQMNSTYRTLVFIGSGNTEATEDDYHMESVLSTGNLMNPQYTPVPGTASCMGQMLSYGEDSDGLYTKILITGVNNGNNDMEIKEVGIGHVFDCSSSQTGGSETQKTVLLYREVLETPLVVSPGLTYEIVVRFNVS